MAKIESEIHDDTIEIINKVKQSNESEIELQIPEGSVLLENVLNLKLLKKQAEKAGKSLIITTSDEAGQNLLAMLDEESSVDNIQEISAPASEKALTSVQNNVERKPSKKITLPKLRFPDLKFGIIIPIILVIAVLAGGLMFLTSIPEAHARVTVNSTPLTKSVTIKAVKGSVASNDTKNIRATTVQADVTETLTVDTTGIKIIGDKAKGTIRIYNKTDNKKQFKKGTVLSYKSGDTTLKFLTTNDVEVPERTQEPDDPVNPGVITYKAGEETVKVESQEFGEKYNIDKDKDLSFDDYKSSEFTAKSTTKMEGGTSKEVKAVAEADRSKVLADLTKIVNDKSLSIINSKLGSEQKLISGSYKVSTIAQVYNFNVGDQAEKLDLTLSVIAEGLTYFENDVENLVSKLTQEFVPEGFELSDKETDLKIEVLGQSDSSVLTATEADLQVTLKTYVVPSIGEDDLKQQLAGKSLDDAKKVLGGIKNIKTYELQISPSIPLFQRVPKDLSRITVSVERE